MTQQQKQVKLTLAPRNDQFNALPGPAVKTEKREKGERIESNGDGTANLYIDGKFVALIADTLEF